MGRSWGQPWICGYWIVRQSHIETYIVLTPTNVDSRPCPELEVGSSPSSWDGGGWYLCTILCCCIYIVSGKMAYIYIVKNGYFFAVLGLGSFKCDVRMYGLPSEDYGRWLRKFLDWGNQTAVFTGCPLISASTEPEGWGEISTGRPLSKLDMNFNQYFQKWLGFCMTLQFQTFAIFVDPDLEGSGGL